MKRILFVLVGLIVVSPALAQTPAKGIWQCAVNPVNGTISPVYIGKLPKGTVVQQAFVVGGYIIGGEVHQLDWDSNTVVFRSTNVHDLLVENLWIVNQPLRCVVSVTLPASKGESQPMTMYSYLITSPTPSKRPVRIRYAWEEGSPGTTQFRVLNIVGEFGATPRNVRVSFGYWLFEPYEVTPGRLRVNTVVMAEFKEAMWPVTVCVDGVCDTHFAWHYWQQ